MSEGIKHQYIKVHVGHIPQHKLEKAVKTGKLSLTAGEVGGTTHTLHLHPHAYKEFLKAKQHNRGVRIHHTHHEIKADLHHHTRMGNEGGSLWSWIKHKAAPWLKKHWSDIKPFVSLALDTGSKFYPEVAPARVAIKNLTGVGLKKRGSHLVKGSAEAKEHMARIRAMKHKGGSFRL